MLNLQVVGKSVTFSDILKEYRNQPQAASHVYRSVLLQAEGSPEAAAKIGSKENSRSASTSTSVDAEVRCDLFTFYNVIFRAELQSFALRFRPSRAATDPPPLSPLPQMRVRRLSPRRKVSDCYSVSFRFDRLSRNKHRCNFKDYSYSALPPRSLLLMCLCPDILQVIVRI